VLAEVILYSVSENLIFILNKSDFENSKLNFCGSKPIARTSG